MATLSYWICSALGIEIEKCSTLTVHGFQDSVISSLMLWQSFFSSRFRDIYFLWNNWWFLRLKFCENGEVQGMYARGLQLGGLATSKAQTWSCEGLFWTPKKNGSKPHKVAKLERKEQHDFEACFVSFLKWWFESFGLKRPKSCIFFKGISSWRLLCCRMKWKRDLIEMRRERLAMPRIQVRNVSSFRRMFDYDVLDNISATACFFQILMFSFRGQHLQRKL